MEQQGVGELRPIVAQPSSRCDVVNKVQRSTPYCIESGKLSTLPTYLPPQFSHSVHPERMLEREPVEHVITRGILQVLTKNLHLLPILLFAWFFGLLGWFILVELCIPFLTDLLFTVLFIIHSFFVAARNVAVRNMTAKNEASAPITTLNAIEPSPSLHFQFEGDSWHSQRERERERERELNRQRLEAEQLRRRLRKQLTLLKDVITRDVLLTKNLHSLLLGILLSTLFLELLGWFLLIGLFTTFLVYILLIIHPTFLARYRLVLQLRTIKVNKQQQMYKPIY